MKSPGTISCFFEFDTVSSRGAVEQIYSSSASLEAFCQLSAIRSALNVIDLFVIQPQTNQLHLVSAGGGE